MSYTTHDVILKFQNRLNKSDSQDYDMLWLYQIEEAFYKGQIDIIRSLKKGKNQKQESDEETSDAIDDLQVLLKPRTLTCSKRDKYSLSAPLPSDYLFYKRVTPLCAKGTCSYTIKSQLREEGNVDDLLHDGMSAPSFEFEQMFHTLAGNRIKIFHNNDFAVETVDIMYYRLPQRNKFTSDKAYPLEFKDDLVELMIDKGVEIMSGDIESLNQNQLAEKRVDKNG